MAAKVSNLGQLGCFAHARRKFYELHAANQNPLAEEVLRRIADTLCDPLCDECVTKRHMTGDCHVRCCEQLRVNTPLC